MTSAERELLLKNLAESRERLLRMAKNLSREELHYRPAPGRWTVAECVEHIVTVEKRLLGAIQKTLETAPDSSKRSAMEGKDDALIAGLVARVTRFQAPEAVLPTGRWPDEQLLQEFEAEMCIRDRVRTERHSLLVSFSGSRQSNRRVETAQRRGGYRRSAGLASNHGNRGGRRTCLLYTSSDPAIPILVCSCSPPSCCAV